MNRNNNRGWNPARSSLLCLAVLTTIYGPSLAATVPAGWRTYRSPDYGFFLAYPKEFTFYPVTPDLKEAQLSYIPICESESVACFEYDGGDAEAGVGPAGLSVNIIREARSEEECNKIDSSHPLKTTIINGIHFRWVESGTIAVSHAVGGRSYRAFHEHVCFELATGVASVSLDPPPAAKDFQRAFRKLEERLDQVVETFRFVGHIVDGPGWKVYSNNMCGGVFEYPETTNVVTAVEYTNKRSDSDEITCEDYFADHELNYTVAAKVSLYNSSLLDKWLRASGYPDLSQTQVLARSKYLTEYKAGYYYYIYGENTLFILSVSNARHGVVSPDAKPMFHHLLNSFKAN